ncbi:MAG TPA: PBP1A family penicillin-binding protein, partial [Acidimicrobiales bacterium]|nr:PBP1A family penicillin-binding protein [Acidimicrobiales bacterium]
MAVSPAFFDGVGWNLRSATRTAVRWAVALIVGGAGLAMGLILVGQQAVDFFTAGSVGSEPERLDLGPLATRSVVHAADGSVIDIFHDEEYRVPVPLDRVPAHVVRAVLDAEDERFYDHGPLDLRAMTRAMVNNLEEGEISEGGSTITQQLVKTVLLTSKQDVDRKLQEAALAIRLEKQMTKDQILERYLNTVYFGNHSYGIQAAAERYYRVGVEHLTVGQATLLAGLIRNPVYADPYDNPEAATERRDVIVDRMVTLGHLSPVQADYVKSEPMPPPLPPDVGPAPGTGYFTEYVKQQLLRDTRLGATDSERYQAVFRGGLSIHTTLNPEYQRMAEESVASILPDTGGQFTAALVTVDPADGAVRAMVGGSDFKQTKFNLVTDTQGRQTGSSFKPFTLIAALEQGMHTNDSILGSAPCVIPNPGSVDGDWKPNNVEGGSAGVLSLTEATVNSVNCAYARLVKLVGPEKVVDVAHRMGITNELDPFLSITLGTGLVTPLQMASAYATLAADGEHHSTYVVSRVDDRDGKAIFNNQVNGERAISEEHARQVNQVLTQVVQRGTGTAARVSGWDVAGKTGSTDNNTNAWFVGYTRTLATAVWMGAPEGDVSMRNVNGVTVYGGTYPAQIWGSFTRKALGDSEPVDFTPPERAGGGGRFLALTGERAPAPDRDREYALDDSPSPARS